MSKERSTLLQKLPSTDFSLLYYIILNMVPSLYFLFSEPLNFPGKITIVLFPLSLLCLIYCIFKNPGITTLVLFPLIFLHSFQIVLFYIFGQEVIASDMFLNVATTNSSEIQELLGSLIPSIALVCVLYIPALILAYKQIRAKKTIKNSTVKRLFKLGIILLINSIIASFFSNYSPTNSFSFKDNVYPYNALYNLNFAINKSIRIKNYPVSSQDFDFKAKTVPQDKRQVYVLIIGETSRADNWSLYNYHRDTNPLLSQQDNLIVFQDVLTQSNATHKSVSILLSDVGAQDYDQIYTRKGIFEAFKQSGFKTICLSNQAENNSFIEYFTKQADLFYTIRQTDPTTRITQNAWDQDLLPLLKQYIDTTTEDLFIVLHTYGSHFNYSQRYKEEFSVFQPDHVTKVDVGHKETLVNAYDNTILNTDNFIYQTIQTLDLYPYISTIMYISDHGEDLFDDQRNRFLHSSPTPTYYQLRVPMLVWYSQNYKLENPQKVDQLLNNQSTPISSNAVFHTIVDLANITTPYLQRDLALSDSTFQIKPRVYLNDHDKAILYQQLNLKQEDLLMFNKNNIKN
ncbi:lipid A phosphoethanolamine transferase [Myroides sp. LJL116]